MSYLCLDLSYKSTGYAAFSKDGKLTRKGKIVPAKEIDKSLKIHYIVGKIKTLFKGMDNLVIEDVYVGKNPESVIWLARLSGGVIAAWVDYKYTKPKLYKATEARALAGAKGNAHKAEIQVFVLEKYKYISAAKLNVYKNAIKGIKELYKEGQYSRGKYKYRLEKLSKQIEEETGMGEDAADCYDNKTEILTDQGWKFFRDLNAVDSVLSMDPRTDNAEYCVPKGIVKQKYCGNMFYYKSKTLDFCITPNHRVLVGDRTRYKFKKISEFNLKSNNNWKIKRTFIQKGKDTKYYVLPSISWKHCLGVHRKYMTVTKPKVKIRMEDWLEFLGWFISEGHLSRCKGNINSVGITQLNPKNIKKICRVIGRIGFTPHVSEYGGRPKNIAIHSPQLARHLASTCYTSRTSHTCLTKKIPNFVFQLDGSLLEVLMKSLILGDGWIDKFSKVRHYSTSSRQLANDVQIVFLKTGKYASILTIHPVNCKKKWYIDHWIQTKNTHYHVNEYVNGTATMSSNKLRVQKYVGNVYCVEASPHHLVYTRRNGRCHWSGNSIVLGIAYSKDPNNKVV